MEFLKGPFLILHFSYYALGQTNLVFCFAGQPALFFFSNWNKNITKKYRKIFIWS